MEAWDTPLTEDVSVGDALAVTVYRIDAHHFPVNLVKHLQDGLTPIHEERLVLGGLESNLYLRFQVQGFH